MADGSRKNTYSLALGGVCLALTVIFLFLASFVPAMELTLYALSSVFVGIMILETSPRGGVILYLAALILSLLLIPNKAALIPYAFFFGIYGIIKFYAEQIKNKAGQIIVKLVLFCAIFGIAYAFFRTLFFGNITLPDYSVILLAIGAILMFLLYDLIYTLILNLYLRRFKNSRSGKTGRGSQKKADDMKLYKEDKE